MQLHSFAIPDVRRFIGAMCVVAVVTTASAGAAGDEPPPANRATLIDVPGSDAKLRVWQPRDGDARAFSSISLDGESFSAPKATSYELVLRHGAFDPTKGQPVDAIARTLRAPQACQLHIVQFHTQPIEAFRRAIEEAGGTILEYLPRHAYIVRMPSVTCADVEAMPFVRWVGPYHPAYRVEEFIVQRAEDDGIDLPELRYNIMLVDSDPRLKQLVADEIVAIAGTVESADAGKRLVEATLTAKQLEVVITWDAVLFVDRWSPYEEDMDLARQIGGADALESVAGWTGQGVHGEVFDGGFNINHADFASRPLILRSPVGSHYHGAATSGIVFGDGTGDPTARGLLSDGQGIVSDFTYVASTGPSRYTHTGELRESPYRAVFQTSSFGSSRTEQYTTRSADMDETIFDFDIVLLQSQSNAGTQMSRPQAWAKNIISVGAVRHFNTLERADDCWCPTQEWYGLSGGSTGPAADGRIKPDLCHFYDYTWTVTTGSPTAYDTFGGTSGATPIVAGHLGLFFQMWGEGIFGNATDPNHPDGRVFGNRCHAMTAKAMMINTAEPYEFEGTGHDLTRTHQGWGVPHVMNIFERRDRMFIVDESVLLRNLESRSFAVNVEAGEPQLRVTLAYADPAGTPGAAIHRVNDLTLRVTSPGGEAYWGNHGLHSGNWSISGGEPNDIDTVENVFVRQPESGRWTIEVMASEINEDGHVETTAVDADFALVVNGGVEIDTCRADLDGDATVGFGDLTELLGVWGPCADCPADLNDDGIVDFDDVAVLLEAWGSCA